MEMLERDDALAQAAEQLLQARCGRGGVLLVAGEAGLGKSSFVAELVRREGPGWRVLRGACEDFFSPRPLGPLHDIAHRHGGELKRRLDEGTDAWTLFGTFYALLDNAAVPSLVVFEDLHWADQATLDLVRFVGRRIGQLPVALVLTYRPEEARAAQPLAKVLGELPARHVSAIALQPLSPAAVERLARAAGRAADGVHAVTGGNPFHVTELLASGIDPAAGVPSAVRDALAARLWRLDAAQRNLLSALSVVPGRVETWLADALLDGSAAARDALDACVALGLLAGDDGFLRFRHELARRAVMDLMPVTERRRRHARVLALLETPPRAAWGRLFHHAAEAADAAAVLRCAVPAGEEAAAVGAHREAARCYGTALKHAAQAPAALRAQLHERWSYEAGIALAIDERVLQARHDAIALWRALGRDDKVGHNLRWLSRLHWYLGDKAAADRYAAEAIDVLEAIEHGPELAWAYGLRAQMFMLEDRIGPAIEWGERAIVLAERLGEHEVLCHALNSVGTAELFAQRPQGEARLARSLALALRHGLHEQAARVYTNLAEHAVVFRDHARAQRLLDEGLAFDREHDLDAWTHYLEGWMAQLCVGRGRLDEARRIADTILERPALTLVMRLPALTVRAQVAVRHGDARADGWLEELLQAAIATGEVQRVVPVALAQAERAWMAGDLSACEQALKLLDAYPLAAVNVWERGQAAIWRRRCGRDVPPDEAYPSPCRLELAGDARGAAEAWAALDCPHEAGLAWLCAAEAAGDDADKALVRACAAFEQAGSSLALERARGAARRLGVVLAPARRSRGRYAASRAHPRGLTRREQHVLRLLVQGRRNDEIARELGVAARTVERHVSSILGKLQARNRHEAAELARRETWVEEA